MASLTTAEFADFLKEYYSDRKLEKLIYPKRPLLALIKKVEKFPGTAFITPMNYAHNQSIAAKFDIAQDAASGTTGKYERFAVTRVKLYGVCNIDGEVMGASEDDAGAFVSARTAEIDGQIEAVSNRLEAALFDSGWGDIGQVATGGVSGSTITLSVTSQIHRVEVGQRHVFAGTQASTVLAGSGSYLTVTGVNRSTGVVTYDSAVSTISGVTDGYWIFNRGDRENSASPTRLLPAGLEAWSPYGGASSTSFFGVNRTADSRLSGLYLDGTSGDLEDNIITMANNMAAVGFAPTHCFVSFGQFSQLVKNVKENQRFVDTVKSADVGFTGIEVLSSAGPVKVVPAHNCPGNRAYCVDVNKLELRSMKKAVRIIDDDGNTVLRQSDSDGLECRIGFKGNLICHAPNSIGTIKLTATGV